MAKRRAERSTGGWRRWALAGPATLTALPTAGPPTPRDAHGPPHLEIDLDRQIVLVVRPGQVPGALDTSPARRRPGHERRHGLWSSRIAPVGTPLRVR